MKKRRKKKFRIIILLIVILIGVVVSMKILNINVVDKIIPSGSYSESTMKNLDSNTKDEILNKAYSKTVDEALTQGVFVSDYLNIYYDINYIDKDNFITKVNLLAEEDYTADQINAIFDNMNYDDIKYFEDAKHINSIEKAIKLDYFIPKYITRYGEYQDQNSDYGYEKIITYVNIGLDYDFYDTDIVDTVTDTNNNLVLVNKYHKVSSDYTPALMELDSSYSIKEIKVTPTTKTAFESLVDAAASKGLVISAVSGYRTYSYQQNLYNNYVASDGKTNADKYPARPGYSEHHTGLAIDVQGGDKVYTEFDETDEYTWVKDNAYLYGFIIRYPEGKENITGYMFESWHIRYVGTEVATYIYKHNITFDEYYAQFLTK